MRNCSRRRICAWIRDSFCLSIFPLLTGNAHAAENFVFETGQSLYRPFNFSVLSSLDHAGIYLNSHSTYSATAADFEAGSLPAIIGSDGDHRIIHATNETGVALISFSGFLSGLQFEGAYEPVAGLIAEERRDIILAAGRNLTKLYTATSGWKGPDKFRCDGLVSYAYAQAGITIPVAVRPCVANLDSD